MDFGILFVPVLGGYLFLKFSNYTRFSIRRQSGHKLLFESAVIGLVLLALARLLVLGFEGWQTVVDGWARFAPFTYVGTVGLAFALGPVGGVVSNLLLSVSEGAMRTIRDAGNTMELLFVESMGSDSTVELSLVNGKVYVGWILNANVAEPERKFVDLLPLASGYREAETHEVDFTTNYAAVFAMLAEIHGEAYEEDYRVVVPVSEIRSARPFDFEVFFLFQEEEELKSDMGEIKTAVSETARKVDDMRTLDERVTRLETDQ